MTFLSNLFKSKSSLNDFLLQEHVVIDVRSMAEFANGHVKDSLCLPLNELPAGTEKLDKEKAIVLCCASGMRSGIAKGLFKKQGFTNVINGGAWHKVQRVKESLG